MQNSHYYIGSKFGHWNILVRSRTKCNRQLYAVASQVATKQFQNHVTNRILHTALRKIISDKSKIPFLHRNFLRTGTSLHSSSSFPMVFQESTQKIVQWIVVSSKLSLKLVQSLVVVVLMIQAQVLHLGVVLHSLVLQLLLGRLRHLLLAFAVEPQ